MDTFKAELAALCQREMDRPGSTPAEMTTTLVEQLSNTVALGTLGQSAAWRGVVASITRTLPEMVFLRAATVRALVEEQAKGAGGGPRA